MRLGTLAVTLVLSASAVAQSSDQVAGSRLADAAGPLLVWRVVPRSSTRPANPASLNPQVKTATAGDFGQTAGSFGQTAGSTGQTAASLGQTAGSFGQTAGSTGQTVSSLGQPASSAGQTAGSTGQTVGSFGESLDTLASAADRSNGSVIPTRGDPEWDSFTSSVHTELGSLSIVYEEVGADELESKLHNRSPDVLLGTPLPSSWSRQDSGLVRRYGLVTLGVVSALPQWDLTDPAENPITAVDRFKVQASILRAAPHPRAARAFVLWLYSRSLCTGCERIFPAAQVPAALARSALFDTINGQRLGSADREAAPFDAQLAQQTALNAFVPALAAGLNTSIDITAAAVNARFAIVALRAVVENRQSFGVVHAVAVLRTDDAGTWHVLQITPNLPLQQQAFAFAMLRSYGANAAPDTAAKVLGVSQAAPVDGDNRDASPELWWDNRGGATLEIVEWQRKADGSATDASWTNSNLFFAPDDSSHLRTRVTGRFADSPGPYRWRIWSVGRGGVIVISSWRSLNILPH